MNDTWTVRLGIVGTGMISEAHAGALKVVPEIQLAGITDINPAAAEGFARKWGTDPYPSYDALLEAVDAVILCTPNDLHEPMAKQALAAGKHLLIEKPMALSGAGAESIRQGYADAGLALMVGHTHRHADYARAVRQAIDDGLVGDVRSVRIAITGGWIWAGWQAWVLDPTRSGGHAFHNGVHLYDLACWWTGSRAERVYAVGQQLTSAALDIDDYLCATLMMESGATAVCEISRGERPKQVNAFEIVVHGTDATLVRRWDSDGLVVFNDDAAGPRPAPVTDNFARQLRVFAAAINGGDAYPSPAAAVHATAIAEAVERSARGQRVEEVTL